MVFSFVCQLNLFIHLRDEIHFLNSLLANFASFLWGIAVPSHGFSAHLALC